MGATVNLLTLMARAPSQVFYREARICKKNPACKIYSRWQKKILQREETTSP
jgi:hypothetical protein